MNPTVIPAIASLVIETTASALKLMKKQKSKDKRRTFREWPKSRKWWNRADYIANDPLHRPKPHSRPH